MPIIRRDFAVALLFWFAGISACAEASNWELEIPLGTRWEIHVAVEERYRTESALNRDLCLDLHGEFTLARLPSEEKFSAFLLKHPGPPELLTEADLALLLDWTRNYFADGYSGVEGTISGTLTWTELPVSYGVTSAAWYEAEGLPTQVHTIAGVVRGGCWLDGLQLFVGPSADPFENKVFRQNRVGHYRYADGSNTEVTEEIEVAFSRIDLPPLGSTLNSLSLTEKPQSYEYITPNIGSERVVITLKPDCPVELSRFDVNVDRITPSWSPNNSLSARKMAELRAKETGKVIDPDASLSGWTHPVYPIKKPRVEVEYSENVGRGKSKVVCLAVDKINVTQELPIVLYIANKYNSSTCPYAALLRHEMKHVQGYTDATDAYLDAVKKTLLGSPAIPSKARPIRVSASAVDGEEKRINQTIIHPIVWRLYHRLREIFQEQEVMIDTAEEYARVRAQCPSSDWE